MTILWIILGGIAVYLLMTYVTTLVLPYLSDASSVKDDLTFILVCSFLWPLSWVVGLIAVAIWGPFNLAEKFAKYSIADVNRRNQRKAEVAARKTMESE